MIATTIALALAAASLPGNYDCAIEHQVVIGETGAQPGSPVSFSGDDAAAWRFSVRLPRDAARDLTVDWPADPIQIAGNHPALTLAPGQVAFAAPARGPCMFTEGNCLTLVELSARDNGSLAFSILPAGSVRNQDGTRSIFHVVFVGSCRRREGGG